MNYNTEKNYTATEQLNGKIRIDTLDGNTCYVNKEALERMINNGFDRIDSIRVLFIARLMTEKVDAVKHPDDTDAWFDQNEDKIVEKLMMMLEEQTIDEVAKELERIENNFFAEEIVEFFLFDGRYRVFKDEFSDDAPFKEEYPTGSAYAQWQCA